MERGATGRGRPRIERSKTCPRCGIEFVPGDWRNTFCSRRCSKLKDLPTRVCAHCGETFTKSNEWSYAVWARIRFCSRRCMGAARTSAPHNCRFCGETYYPQKHGSLYCNQTCYGRWIEANASLDPCANGDFSRATKRVLLETADNRCQRCGSTEHLEFDHILPRAAGGEGTAENGQVLCQPCHLEKTLGERLLQRALLHAHYGLNP